MEKVSILHMKHLLIVDDEPAIRLLLREVFQKEDFETTLAANGQEAIALCEQQTFDCALLDMRMPGMTGLETLIKIRDMGMELPVIMMTAYGERDLIERAQQLGIKGYFTKPFNIFDIRDAVQKIFAT